MRYAKNAGWALASASVVTLLAAEQANAMPAILAWLVAACSPTSYQTVERIETDGTVLANDNSTGVDGLSIQAIEYDLTVKGEEGVGDVVATKRLEFGSDDLMTTNGAFSTVDSVSLSHDEVVTECTTECAYYYEDEDGYTYCGYYYDDCYDVVESFSDSVSEITDADTTIEYLSGSSTVSTEGTQTSDTYDKDEEVTEYYESGKEKTVVTTKSYSQAVTFVTPLEADAQFSTAGAKAASKAKSRKSGVAKVGNSTIWAAGKAPKRAKLVEGVIETLAISQPEGLEALESLLESRKAIRAIHKTVEFAVSDTALREGIEAAK